MPLSERTPTPSRKGGTCTIGVLLSALEPSEADVLTQWLGDISVEGTWIAEQLSDELGRKVGADSVRRHRRRHCLCDSAPV